LQIGMKLDTPVMIIHVQGPVLAAR
jgi:hypothetical protein